MSFRHTYIRGGGFTTDNQGRGLFRVRASSGGGGTTDTVARILASTAQNNINALTAQASEVIPVNGVVYGPWGTLKNQTAAPITLDATDPQTEATLLASGLTPIVGTPSVNELMAQAGKAVAPGETVYMPFGEYTNATAGTITLGVTDPPTNASLLADGLTAPAANGVDQLMAEPGEIIAPGETVYMPYGVYTNATAGNITVGVTDPPTEASLLADGLTVPARGADNLQAEPGETIAPGETVYMAFGEYKNETAGNITLGVTDPPTDASLIADGLTKQIPTVPDTGTNIPVAAAAFADVEAPTIAELETWKTANVGPGLTFPIAQTIDDLYFYTSAQGKSFTWAVGDAESGTDALALVAFNDPNAAGGYEFVPQAAVAPLTPSAKPDTLRHYEITATTPTEIANDGTNDYTVVRFTVPDSTPTSEPMRIDRNSAVHISLFGKVNSAVDEHFIINEDLRGVWLKPAAGGLWTASF